MHTQSCVHTFPFKERIIINLQYYYILFDFTQSSDQNEHLTNKTDKSPFISTSLSPSKAQSTAKKEKQKIDS